MKTFIGTFLSNRTRKRCHTLTSSMSHHNGLLSRTKWCPLPVSSDKCGFVWIFFALGHYLTKSSALFKTIDKSSCNSMFLTRPSIRGNQECIQHLQFVSIKRWKYFNQTFFQTSLVQVATTKGFKSRLISRITSCKLTWRTMRPKWSLCDCPTICWVRTSRSDQLINCPLHCLLLGIFLGWNPKFIGGWDGKKSFQIKKTDLISLLNVFQITKSG